MELLLAGAVLSLVGLAVAWMGFHASRPGAGDTAPAGLRPVPAPARFFADPAPTRVPLERLLLQIEDHIREEQAAAESFLAAPNPVLLHGRTSSPMAGGPAC